MRLTAMLRSSFALVAVFALGLGVARADPPRSEVVRLVRVAPIASPPLTSTEIADYVGLVVAILDECTRGIPNRGVPFAGRAQLVVTVSTTLSLIEILDVEPGVRELGERCLANAPPLPPLRAPTLAAMRTGPGYGRFAMEVRLDARGFPDETMPRRAATTRVELDGGSITFDRYDGRREMREIRDELLRGMEPALTPLFRCFENQPAPRDGSPRIASRLALRIDRDGNLRSTELADRTDAAPCVRAVLRGFRLAGWTSTGDTVVGIDLVVR